MGCTEQPDYLTSQLACVEEVGYLANVLAELVALAADLDHEELTTDQWRHRLQVLVVLALDRPSVQRLRHQGGAR